MKEKFLAFFSSQMQDMKVTENLSREDFSLPPTMTKVIYVRNSLLVQLSHTGNGIQMYIEGIIYIL